jgi:uncharacterized membrane protein YuzA (DUF378 family)
MVAIAAFLIILVIIFGLENVRSFIFGTFGIVAWIAIIILGLGALVLFGEWCHKIGIEQKKEHEEERKKKAQEKAEFLKLKTENPKEYKSIRRFNAIMIGGLITFVVVFAVLIVILIATHE